MLRQLLLPLFLVRLGITLIPTIVSLGWVKISLYKPLLIALALLLMSLSASLIHRLTYVSPTPPPNPILVAQQFFESVSSQQPTHRDVLLNLSRVYQAFGNSEKAQEYQRQARELDPNNSVFTNEK